MSKATQEKSNSPEGTQGAQAPKTSKSQFPDDWKDQVIVRQCQVEIVNGGMIEVPNTHQIQTYAPATFDKLKEDNFFSECKMKVEVLHDPRN